jgi:low affinity Fe/Cu permease
MQEIIQTSPVILVIIGLLLFAFAVIMQPIFIWIICARLKRTNQLLAKMETKIGLKPPVR